MTRVDHGNTKVIAIPEKDAQVFISAIEAVMTNGTGELNGQQQIDYVLFLVELYEHLSGKSADALVKLHEKSAETAETKDTVDSQENKGGDA